MGIQIESTGERDPRLDSGCSSRFVENNIYRTQKFRNDPIPKTVMRRAFAAGITRLTLSRFSYILVGMLATRKTPPRTLKRLRTPRRTRDRLLQAAFREVFKYGFQGAGVDRILAATNVTKGALYYHFESKEALGYAVIEEIVAQLTRERWLLPLQRNRKRNAIDALIRIVRAIPGRPRDVKSGCPLVHLAQEMSQLDEQFRKRLQTVFRGWQEGVASTLRRGQVEGTVRRDLVPEEAASFLVAMIEGYEVLAKNAQDVKVWNMGMRNIVGWLNSLRAAGNRR